jgi:hypothetical protein
VGFFDVPPPPEPPRQRHRQPVWSGPPENVLGGVAPLRVVVARTERVAVAAIGASAYPQGVTFDLVVRAHPSAEDDWDGFFDPFGHHARHRRRAGEPWPSSHVLRFGVAWPDGRKATTVGGPGWPMGSHGPEEPEGPLLNHRGGGGGGLSWSLGLWLWPLPPPGTIEFVCEWPSERIPETRVPVETAPLLEAAARAETLWPEEGDDPGGGGGFGSFQFVRSHR